MGTGRQAAIIGIGALPFSKDIDMSERESGARAVLLALDDAGIDPHVIDGLVRFSWENTTEAEMARLLGLGNVRMFGSVDYGGCAGAPVTALAAMAIESGVAETVVVWRARNRGSGGRPWMQSMAADGQNEFEWPFGLVRPVDSLALAARHWMHRYGWQPDDLFKVASNGRRYAQNNPAALMRTPLSIDDYLGARMIADPLRLYDCCLESDGALAVVLVSAERAADLDVTPAYVDAYALGTGPEPYLQNFFYNGADGRTPAAWAGAELWSRSGLTAADIDVAQIYDAFTPEVLISLEEYGFCDEGTSPDYLDSPDAVPYNTSGGSLAEAYVHGFNLIVEGVRQVRGTSVNQVADAKRCLVTSGQVGPTGAFVLSSEAWN